jgi:hypothetical protein
MRNGSPAGTVLTDDEREVLQRLCGDAGVPCDVIEHMIAAENQVYGMGRRHGIWEMLESLVAEGINRGTPEGGTQ